MESCGWHFLSLAPVQSQHAVTPPGKVQVVGDDEGGEPVLTMKPLDQLENQLGCSVIQVSGGLIGHQYLWPCYQGPGQSHPLLLAPGEFSRTMMAAIAEADFPQPCSRFFHRGPVTGSSHEKRHGNILLRRKLRQQIMKLPDKANLAIAKVCCSIICEFAGLNLGAVYVTLRSTIKHSQNMQQTAFA